MENKQSDTIHHLKSGDKEIILIGTAHVSQESADEVAMVIEREKPDTVSIELCPARFQTIRQKDQWRNMDIVKVIKEKKAFLLLSNLLLSSFQKRIADKLGVKPGLEMLTAISSAETADAEIHLADRDVQTTLARVWRSMGIWEKTKLITQLVFSMGAGEEISEEEIEKMKQSDVLQTILEEVGKSHPILKETLITERDKYLAQKIKTAPGEKIVAVVGAGHVPGIKRYWEEEINLSELEELPPKGKLGAVFKWGLPSMILLAMIGGFFYGGSEAGTEMIWWWFAANGILAGIGAIIAMAHPLTILSSVLAAPITSLNPMIAAGWVSGLVEAFSRKPKVRDFENLGEDILSARGFWKNNITRILLVVVFTNLGSMAGTFIAIPLMLKALGS